MVAAIVAEREVTSVPTTGLKITPAVMVRGMAGTARTCGRAKMSNCRGSWKPVWCTTTACAVRTWIKESDVWQVDMTRVPTPMI